MNTIVNTAPPDAPIVEDADAPPATWPTEHDAATAWNPLALFMAILPGPAVVTPNLALGQT